MDQEPQDTRPTMQDLFPEMKPFKHSPTLATFNSIGAGFYGKRGADDLTGTYVTTHCLCVLFLPIIALASYRVMDTGGSSYRIFGRVPLSRFAKGWNKALLGAALCFALYATLGIYMDSDAYHARQEMKVAATQLKEGHPAEAAEAYRNVYTQYSAYNEESWTGMTTALDACLASNTTETEDAAFRVINHLPSSYRENAVPGAFDKGVTLVKKRKESMPVQAMNLFRLIKPLAPKDQDLEPLRKEILQRWMVVDPTLLQPALELATQAETEGDIETAGKILEPYKDHLENGEGARILGQWYMQSDRNDDAYKLLHPYVEMRLKAYHSAEKKYDFISNSCYDQALEDLRHGGAGDNFYRDYDASGKAAQDAMVDKYLNDKVKNNPRFKNALQEVQAAGEIVPVALDLGIVQLNRAREMQDADARQVALNDAESTFLAIQGAAAESDGYRLYLGQVYYWLGKHKEGRDLLEQLLESHDRDSMTLYSLAKVATLVGESTWARSLREEAYKKADQKEEKYNIARALAANGNDVDDRLTWLERADPNDASVKIDFNYNRGIKAAKDGDKDAAIDYYNTAINAYRSMPQNGITFNNEALVHLELYALTGNKTSLVRSVELMDQAIKLSPENSILIGNVASTLLPIGLSEIAVDSMAVDAIPDLIDLDVLDSLYDSMEEKEQLCQRYRRNVSIGKVLDYYDKLLTLAPKDSGNYSAYHQSLRLLRDTTALAAIKSKIEQSAPDISSNITDTKDWYLGTNQVELLKNAKTRLNDLEKLVTLPAIQASPVTLSYVYTSICDLEMRLYHLGKSPDSDKLMDLAKMAHALHPSANTRGTLLNACFFNAHAQLCEQSIDYRVLAETTHRALSPRELIEFLLEQNGDRATAIRQMESIQKTLTLMKELEERFPGRSRIETWACFEHSDSDYAAAMAAKTQGDQASKLNLEITTALNPLSASAVLKNYWLARMENHEADAVRIYEQALKAGIPLPPLKKG